MRAWLKDLMNRSNENRREEKTEMEVSLPEAVRC